LWFNIIKINAIMTTDVIDIERDVSILLKNMEKFPDVAQYVNDNNWDVPAFFFEEELFSQEEFKAFFEQILLERLGLKIDLSATE